MPFSAKIPPTIAIITQLIFPICTLIGPNTFANLFALQALSNNSSFSCTKRTVLSCSWQNTLTTFCPSIISSIKPLTAPRFFCWRIKNLPLCDVIFFVTQSMMPIRNSASTVSGILSKIMLTKTLTIVITLLISCGILWLIIWRSVSTSFVYMDIISPCACVSKYLIGSVSIWRNISSRRLRRLPCVTYTIILVFKYAATIPMP